jgi:hypothetical protein
VLDWYAVLAGASVLVMLAIGWKFYARRDKAWRASLTPHERAALEKWEHDQSLPKY